MIWIREIKHGVAQNNQQLLVFAYEYTSEWMILGFYNHALSCPLPKLGLGGPELLGVATDNEGCVLPLLFLFFPFFFFTQCSFPPCPSEEPLGRRSQSLF